MHRGTCEITTQDPILLLPFTQHPYARDANSPRHTDADSPTSSSPVRKFAMGVDAGSEMHALACDRL